MGGASGTDHPVPVQRPAWDDPGWSRECNSGSPELALHDACVSPWPTADDSPRFPLGRTVITANAASVLADSDIFAALSRHVRGDWGELDENDRAANDRALVEGTRILSAYRSSTGIRFWIITEWDRSITTVLLPEDY